MTADLDPFGYAAERAHKARYLGVTLASIEREFPDARLRDLRKDHETASEREVPPNIATDYLMDQVLGRCQCGRPSHLSVTERRSVAELMVGSFFVDPDDNEMHRRYDVTVRQAAEVVDHCVKAGRMNRDRCLALSLGSGALGGEGGLGA